MSESGSSPFHGQAANEGLHPAACASPPPAFAKQPLLQQLGRSVWPSGTRAVSEDAHHSLAHPTRIPSNPVSVSELSGEWQGPRVS